MKEWTWALMAIISLSLINCGKTDKNPTFQYDENKDSIPRFDSLNWAAEFQFQPVNLIDKIHKYRILDHFYKDFWQRTQVSGGFLVAQNGKILYEDYSGFSDSEKQTRITAHTPLHIASITKVMTGLAILKLVEYKKLKLNDKAAKYLKGFPYEEVTVEDLLNHRSGLPNYLHLSEDKKYWDKSKMMTNQDVLQLLIDHQPEILAKAGKKFAYNNTNYVLLALIIEKITGMSYAEAMDYMVFKPLGMTDTFVFEFEKDSAKVSKSYEYNGKEWAYDHLDATYGDKNVYSTPRDLLKMDMAMYADQFLPKNLKEKAWKGYSYESRGVKNYGLGIRLMEWDNGNKILYHNGWWHGNNSTYVRDFDNQATIIALGNRRNRTIYSAFRLVSLFGDYPFQAPLKRGSGAEDSLKDLHQKIDSVKAKATAEKKSAQEKSAN
ncbi:MAG: serine hydrolase domain-containing protein [Moheibacter sp.]